MDERLIIGGIPDFLPPSFGRPLGVHFPPRPESIYAWPHISDSERNREGAWNGTDGRPCVIHVCVSLSLSASVCACVCAESAPPTATSYIIHNRRRFGQMGHIEVVNRLARRRGPQAAKACMLIHIWEGCLFIYESRCLTHFFFWGGGKGSSWEKEGIARQARETDHSIARHTKFSNAHFGTVIYGVLHPLKTQHFFTFSFWIHKDFRLPFRFAFSLSSSRERANAFMPPLRIAFLATLGVNCD